MPPSPLTEEFDRLATAASSLISLLQDNNEPYWASQLQRGLAQIQSKQLSGATFVLGCYGGTGTLSDLMIASDTAGSNPGKFAELNAQLTELRTQVFESANQIASRNLW